MKDKVILLIDMDAFYASCIMLKEPELKGQPLVVASQNAKAIATTTSYEARKFGIKSGMPIFQIKKILPSIIIKEPDFDLFVEISNKVFTYIRDNYSKIIEVVSIDEAYLDVTNYWKKYGSVKKMTQNIRKNVKENFGITCSIGISTNKFLAKMASEMNKPDGEFVLIKKDIDKYLWPLDVEKMYGVGNVTKKILNDNGLFKISDIANTNLDYMTNILGKRGYNIFWNANGNGSDDVVVMGDESKNISNEMTLSDGIKNVNEIEEYLFQLCSTVSIRLKKKNKVTSVLTISFKYSYSYSYEGFDKTKHIKKISHQLKLSKPTNDLEIIFSNIKSLFYDIWNEKPVMLLGVGASDLNSNIKEFKQISFDDDYHINNYKKFNKNIFIDNKYLMSGLEYEKKYDKKMAYNNYDVSKIDNDRISEKKIKESFKK